MRIAALLVCLLLPSAGWAWGDNLTLPAAAPVVDEAGLLDRHELQELDGLLRQIKQSSSVEIAIYITPSLQGRSVEDFSMAVAQKWGLGRKKEDKGLLFLVAPKERKMRFEVGYALEGDITDAFSRRVLDDTVRPYFKAGEYYGGIRAGIVRLQEKIPLGLAAEEVEKGYEVDGRLFPLLFFVVIFLIFGAISSFFRFLGLGGRRGYQSWGNSSRHNGWGGFGGGGFGGRGGGGSWGGGGGSFGGGGSSSSW